MRTGAQQVEVPEVMKREQNPLTGDWLCWIPGTSQAYYYNKSESKKFCDKINRRFLDGSLQLIDGKVVLNTSN